jgi:hypothetical protein
MFLSAILLILYAGVDTCINVLVFHRNTLWVEKLCEGGWRSVGTHCAHTKMAIAQNVPMERKNSFQFVVLPIRCFPLFSGTGSMEQERRLEYY